MTRVIQHLKSEAHKEVVSLIKLTEKWNNKDSTHPWIRAHLNSVSPTCLKTLFQMVYTVRNDCKYLTLPEYNSSSRILSLRQADQQFNHFFNATETTEFLPFKPTGEDLHYLNGSTYSKILKIMGGIERTDMRELLESDDCIVFAGLIDGSRNKRNVDNKYCMIRIIMRKDVLKNIVAFLSVENPTQDGADGLLEALLNSFKSIGLSDEVIKKKFAGITTDGESANTGPSGGLWAKLQSYLGRKCLTFWCACHRSDLANEALFEYVPEMNLWHQNLKSVSTFYRTSSKQKST